MDAPFRKKEGNLETSAIFNYGDPDITNEVSLTEKNNQFKIVFGLFEPDGDWHKSSGFTFQCLSSTFVPSVYPTEICGEFLLLLPDSSCYFFASFFLPPLFPPSPPPAAPPPFRLGGGGICFFGGRCWGGGVKFFVSL